MKIICGKCEKQYNIDASKLTEERTGLLCKACGETIMVTRPGFSPSREGTSAAPVPQQNATRPQETATRKIRFGLLYKVVFAMLLVSIVPFGLFIGITFNEARDRIRTDTEVLMGQTADGLGRHVDEWIDKNVRMLKLTATLADVTSMQAAKQEAVLKTINAEYPYIYLAFTLDANGMNLARNDGKSLKDYSDRQYYKSVAEGKAVAWQTLIGKTSKKPALVLAVPIKKGSRTVGVMAAAMTTDAISKQVANWKQGETGFAYLVDETGKAVAHQVHKYVTSQENFNSNPLIAAFKRNPGQPSIAFTDSQGKKQQGYARANKMGWILAIQQSDDEVFAAHKRSEKIALYLLGITLFLIVFFALLLARNLVKPIRELTDITTRMSMGELDIAFNIKSKDEIGQLAGAIRLLQTSLGMAMQRLRQKSQRNAA